MAQPDQLISTDNPVFRAYIFYCAVLVVKMLLMSLLTAKQRISKKIFANPEDATLKNAKVKYDDPDVERVRRAHLNDLENIPIFMGAAFFYLTTNPAAFLAVNLFRAFTLARIVHTLVYAVVVVPQPARGLSWAIGYVITGYMAITSILYYL